MKNVFDYIKEEEAAYKTRQVPIADGYEWNMYEHVRKCTLYRDSRFTEGVNDGSRPFKNIIRRIITLQHFATGFDVKDIEPFVSNSDYYYKSLIVRKFHEKWARKNSLDTFIDETVESYVDFGLALSKHINKIGPENVPLQSLAFCDATDILSGPICIKHEYSPAQLHDFDSKWQNIDEVITLARAEKTDAKGNITKTPGKFIEAYELDGVFPVAMLKQAKGEDYAEADIQKYTQQFYMVTFYKNDQGERKGIILYAGKGDSKKYKAVKRDPIFGRACGMGGIEELLPAQVATNLNAIYEQDMLETVSKVIGVTDDKAFATRNKISDMENGEWLTLAEGKTASTLNLQPINFALFENASQRWEQHAQDVGSANDALLGESPTAGTPFKLQDLLTQQGKGPHDYRKGKLAIYVGEIYRDWILKDLVSEMNNEQEFIADLSIDEMEYVANSLVNRAAFEYETELVLTGQTIDPQKTEELRQRVRAEWTKRGGSKHFFKVLKDELKSLPVDVEVNIAGKQKNLAGMADKLSNIFRNIFANPQGFVQTMQIPGMGDAFNEMLEASGLSPVNFSNLKNMPSPIQQEQGAPDQKQPLQVAA